MVNLFLLWGLFITGRASPKKRNNMEVIKKKGRGDEKKESKNDDAFRIREKFG